MKVIASLLSVSLTAITILPAAALDISSSDRALWIESTLAGTHSSKTNTKKTSTVAGKSTSITSAGSSSLAHSVADLYAGIKMRPFVANRYLPSERDIEAAQAQAAAAQSNLNTAQLPASTVQLAKAMATTQAMNARANSIQNRINTLNALMPSIPEPMSSNETVGQIRSSLRNNDGQLVASAQNSGYGANLYPDIVGPVPTQATPARSVSSPLGFLSQKSTRQYTSAGNRTTATGNTNLSASTFGSWQAQQSQRQGQYLQQATQPQHQASRLSFGGFHSYTGKLHIQGTTARSNAQIQNSKAATYTSSLPADCNIASADCYSTAMPHVSSYTPYTSSQSSSLPY